MFRAFAVGNLRNPGKGETRRVLASALGQRCCQAHPRLRQNIPDSGIKSMNSHRFYQPYSFYSSNKRVGTDQQAAFRRLHEMKTACFCQPEDSERCRARYQGRFVHRQHQDLRAAATAPQKPVARAAADDEDSLRLDADLSPFSAHAALPLFSARRLKGRMGAGKRAIKTTNRSPRKR